uniref:Uncharacterized protein n=1 Tax=Opuntia streptacantha TaxID=393608 RepID=A0A7C9ADH2_OPUST
MICRILMNSNGLGRRKIMIWVMNVKHLHLYVLQRILTLNLLILRIMDFFGFHPNLKMKKMKEKLGCLMMMMTETLLESGVNCAHLAVLVMVSIAGATRAVKSTKGP